MEIIQPSLDNRAPTVREWFCSTLRILTSIHSAFGVRRSMLVVRCFGLPPSSIFHFSRRSRAKPVREWICTQPSPDREEVDLPLLTRGHDQRQYIAKTAKDLNPCSSSSSRQSCSSCQKSVRVFGVWYGSNSAPQNSAFGPDRPRFNVSTRILHLE